MSRHRLWRSEETDRPADAVTTTAPGRANQRASCLIALSHLHGGSASPLAPYPGVPRKEIEGICTIIKHQYHWVDPNVIWSMAKVHSPMLRRFIKKMHVDAE